MKKKIILLYLAVLLVPFLSLSKERSLTFLEAFTPSIQGDMLQLKIQEGYYVYQESLGAYEQKKSLKISSKNTPILKNDPIFGTNTPVYKNTLTLKFPKESTKITVQGCRENGLCYPRYTILLKKPMPNATLLFDSLPPPIFKSNAPKKIHQKNNLRQFFDELSHYQNNPKLLLQKLHSSFYSPLWMFLLGILLVFTPCVWVTYPLILGLLLRLKSNTPQSSSWHLALVYVFFMALSLGLLALGSAFFGSLLIHLVHSGISNILSGLALFLLGASFLFNLSFSLPNSWVTKINSLTPHASKGPYLSSAILGSFSSILVSACLSAPLLALFTFSSSKGSLPLGFAWGFALGLGLGVPLLFLSLFPAILKKKSALFLSLAKRLMPPIGALFLFLGFEELSFLIHGSLVFWVRNFFILMLLLSLLPLIPKGIWRLPFLSAWVLLVLASIGLPSFSQRADPKLNLPYLETPEALSSFLEEKSQKPKIIIVTAKWCANCRTMERTVYSDPEIIQALQQNQAYFIDITKNTQNKVKMLQKLHIQGPPAFWVQKDLDEPSLRFGLLSKHDILQLLSFES